MAKTLKTSALKDYKKVLSQVTQGEPVVLTKKDKDGEPNATYAILDIEDYYEYLELKSSSSPQPSIEERVPNLMAQRLFKPDTPPEGEPTLDLNEICTLF